MVIIFIFKKVLKLLLEFLFCIDYFRHFVTLRKSTTFRKVYWSVPFVTLRKARSAFSQSILVSTVCYFAKSPKGIFRKVYWSVPFVCLSVCHTPYRPQFCTDQDYFFTVDSAYPHIDTKLLLKKSAKGQGQGHQKP